MSRRNPLFCALAVAAAVTLLFAVGAQAQAAASAPAKEKAAAHKFVGSDPACKMCHSSEAKGNQYGVWLKSMHAKAFETLAGEKALAIAKEKKLAKAPQEEAACLKCHVTGAGVAADMCMPTFKKEQGVGCESCHGAGSDYKNMAIMKDKAKAIEAGLVMPDEKTCTGCHNQESPTFKAFVFKEMVAKIAHPYPPKKAG
jgi:hypothetical protein